MQAMGGQKRLGILLLAAVLAACTRASPAAEPSTAEQEQDGYLESRRSEVEVCTIIILGLQTLYACMGVTDYTGFTSGQHHLHLQLCC